MSEPVSEIEKVARAICLKIQFNDFGFKDTEGNWQCKGAQIDLLDTVTRAAAQAAIAALDQARAEKGLVLVPREPTETIEDAGDQAMDAGDCPADVWRFMIAAYEQEIKPK